MHRSKFSTVGIAIAATAFVVGCREQAPIPHTPTTIVMVSGNNQSGNLSAALDSSLVVQVKDAAGKSVSGVPLTWTVTGGGTLSATSTTTGNDGKSSVQWTLASSAGTQVVTVTSAQVTGATVAFVATNGAVLSGTVTPAGGSPFGASFSRTASRSARLATSPSAPKTLHVSTNRIVVGFKSETMGVAAAGSGAYRSISVARDAASRLKTRVASLMASRPLSHAEISPALVAARIRVDDPTQTDAMVTALRADPNVAWVERDGISTIRDGAPHPMSTSFIPRFDDAAPGASSNVVAKIPNDPFYWEQEWPAAMIDLPRAWSITTGSPNVTVAVVDMGVRFDHPAIAANLTKDGYDFVSQLAFDTPQKFCNSAETFTTIDGDGDGPDADPTDPDDLEFVVGQTGDVVDDPDNCWQHSQLGDHGLWTSGIIGAVGNDGQGMAGVNWNVKIRPIRVLGVTGDGSNFDIAQGVLYAAGLPATGANGDIVQAPSRSQIINMSLGGPSPSTTLQNAINAAVNAGSLIVASAGNDGLDFPAYPAAFPGVMAVAAVGMDGALATYSNAGTFVSVAAPGGDFRLDDNGGGGVLGPGWDFDSTSVRYGATYLFGYGTSAAAPFVSGIAALMLAQNPGLTASDLRTRIEQYATRGAGLTRSDALGWGVVNAYNALTQQNGPPRQTIARLLDATTGAVKATINVASDGSFAFTKLQNGSYFLQAGDDESGDATIGVPGRRFGWAGTFGKPTVFNVNNNSHAAAIVLGVPSETEPNDDIAHANMLSVGSYVTGSITTPDVRDVYSVAIPVAGIYTFETSGLVGSCGLGVELDTFLSVSSATGTNIGTNDNSGVPTGRFCSRVQASLTPGIYYVTVTGTGASGLSSHGRYRLEVRSGT